MSCCEAACWRRVHRGTSHMSAHSFTCSLLIVNMNIHNFHVWFRELLKAFESMPRFLPVCMSVSVCVCVFVCVCGLA